MTSAPVAIDLFAGCGGMSTGLLDAGIKVVAGFDIDRRSVTTFDYNHLYRGCRGFNTDLNSVAPHDLLTLAGVEKVDLITGGPPCQSFSIAGHRRGLADLRGSLVFRFLDIVRSLSPQAVVFENVPNIVNIEGGRLVKRLADELRAAGYGVSAQVLAAADYGVAQQRKRYVMVGVRDAKQVPFPPSFTHSPQIGVESLAALRRYVTVAEAIGDLPDVNEPAAADVPNHEPTVHTAEIVEEFRNLAPGRRHAATRHDRLHPDRLSYTLRAGSGNFSPLRPVHYKYHRVVSVRESARLQGFSDDFIWPDPVPRLQQYRQVGNAVPPPLASAVGKHLAEILDWKLDQAAVKGDTASRPPAFFMTAEERLRERARRSGRGASAGKRRRGGTVLPSAQSDERSPVHNLPVEG